MLGAVNEITVPMQLQRRALFADSSPMASLKPLKMMPPTQIAGAKIFRMADCRLLIIVSTPAKAKLELNKPVQATMNVFRYPNLFFFIQFQSIFEIFLASFRVSRSSLSSRSHSLMLFLSGDVRGFIVELIGYLVSDLIRSSRSTHKTEPRYRLQTIDFDTFGIGIGFC